MIKIEFCPMCNFRFVRATLIIRYREPISFWSDHWYNCPLCKLHFLRTYRNDESTINRLVLGKCTSQFLEISKLVTEQKQSTFPKFTFEKLNFAKISRY